MIRTTSFFAALLAGAGLFGTGALLASHAQASAALVHLAAQARVSLEQAIAAAQQPHPGSQIVRAALDGQRGAAYYEVEAMNANHQVFDLKIDAGTGRLVSDRLDRAADRDTVAVADLAGARVALEQVLAAARQRHPGGKVTSVELSREWGTVYYAAEVVDARQRVFELKIDAEDGQILSSTPQPHAR